jgi:amino acid adenylation domain-containing protein
MHQLFERRALESPSATALVCGDERLSYEELNARANRLARRLRQADARANVPVGICMYRSVDMIVSLLACLKAGAAYVPIDPSYPEKRIAGMLQQANLKVILTHKAVVPTLPGQRLETVCLDSDRETIAAEDGSNLAPAAGPEDLCYVIFTSGSTGVAKAAAVCNRGWINLMYWFVTEFDVQPADRVLVASSFSFDITQRSIVMPLIRGAELHLLPSRTFDAELTLTTVAESRITIVNCAPSTFYPLVEAHAAVADRMLRSLRILFLGGEAISATRIRRWAEGAEGQTEVVNVYGAAECSDVSTFYRLRDYARYVAASVPIGMPIYNTQIYLLGEDLKPVDAGESGELCIAGDGVGKGYINDESLTAEKFVPNPFSTDPEDKLYRTGDLARLLPDGTLEFIGRKDHQVKLRGFRIDLGDVESTLRQNGSVREVVVLPREFGPNDQRLIAFAVPQQKGMPRHQLSDELRAFSKERLPDHMIPSDFVVLPEMPLSPNGKIDRNALVAMEIEGTVRTGADEPRTPVETKVASLLAKTLKVDRIGVRDNFFDLGGNSYLLTEVLVALSADLGARVSITDFLAGPSVAQLAEVIGKQVSV